ncbi:hypothetical protein [Rathayibacter rathayi]|uniref:hypothetical protein n=1 Tax=Rathayibacter rathayi TaxID=33887 RepID=UPI001CA5D1F5|nr:hypothetical protein [Rathayibacter rathayi]
MRTSTTPPASVTDSSSPSAFHPYRRVPPGPAAATKRPPSYSTSTRVPGPLLADNHCPPTVNSHREPSFPDTTSLSPSGPLSRVSHRLSPTARSQPSP